VLDPTLIWDFSTYRLEPVRNKPYIAVYSWLDTGSMQAVRKFASANKLEVVCVGCRHPDADVNIIGIGPEEWMRLIKHSSAVVTDFFHGVLFSLIFHRPFYAHVDEKKKMKLQQALGWVGLTDHLHDEVRDIADLTLSDLGADWQDVESKLAPKRLASRQFIDDQLAAVK